MKKKKDFKIKIEQLSCIYTSNMRTVKSKGILNNTFKDYIEYLKSFGVL